MDPRLKNQLANDVKSLLEYFESSQWNHRVDMRRVANLPVLGREDLRNMRMEKGFFTCKTSGSTGEPVSVEKTYDDYVWYFATNIRIYRWRKWDVTKNVAIIKAAAKKSEFATWGIPARIEPVQGNSYINGYEPISVLQEWLEEKNPHYIMAAPSIIESLDKSRLTNLIDWKGTGEVGGSMYSSQECGTIALECPDNKSVMHVMENQIIETDSEGGLLITTLSNPYIRRYRHGDKIEFGNCHCGRTLQTIKKVNGRIRNMFVMPNGDRKWPLIGSREYFEKFGISRFKAIQTAIGEIELQLICSPLGEKEDELVSLVKKSLESPVNVTIKYVNGFKEYKFEEFVSLIN
jgi:phenylacetate-CoA ligase